METIKDFFAPLGIHKHILDCCGRDPVSSIFGDAKKLAAAAVCVRRHSIWAAVAEILQTAYDAFQAYDALYRKSYAKNHEANPKRGDYYDSGFFYEPAKASNAIKQLAAYAEGKLDSTQLFELCADVANWDGTQGVWGWDTALLRFIEAAAQYSINEEYAQGEATDMIWEAIDKIYDADGNSVFSISLYDEKGDKYLVVRDVLIEIIKKHLFPNEQALQSFLP